MSKKVKNVCARSNRNPAQQKRRKKINFLFAFLFPARSTAWIAFLCFGADPHLSPFREKKLVSICLISHPLRLTFKHLLSPLFEKFNNQRRSYILVTFAHNIGQFLARITRHPTIPPNHLPQSTKGTTDQKESPVTPLAHPII